MTTTNNNSLSMLTSKTPADLKRWARKNRDFAKIVLTARVHADLERERVNAYIAPVFAGFTFVYDEISAKPGERITDPEMLYQTDDNCDAYYAACDAAHRANGFTGPEGHCPALAAETLKTDAETAMVNLLGEFCGLGDRLNCGLDVRKKALEMALEVCLGKLV